MNTGPYLLCAGPTARLAVRAAAALAALALAAAAQAGTMEGTVVRVTDGDSVWFKPDGDGKPFKLRLEGLDAPERCQPGGEQAREALSSRVLKRRATVRTEASDDYHRAVGTLKVDGEDIGAWLVLQGHAWTRGYRKAPAPYAKQELDARAARRGVFADPQAQEPRSFRRQHGPCD